MTAHPSTPFAPPTAAASGFVATVDEAGDHTASVELTDNSADAGVARQPSVVVLPLANLVAEPAEDYFADGITEDITTALSKNRWLTVIARNSAVAFRNSSQPISTIGATLGADYVVTGSVRKVGSRVRVSIQVVDAATESNVWSERFDRDLIDIFDLQDDITEVVSSRIESELGLTEQRKAERRPRKNRGVWDLYQLGAAEFYKFTPESNQRCQELLRQAIKLDPELPSAHSRLAYAVVLSMVYFDADPAPALLDEALASAKRAIALDHQDANGYFTIGRVPSPPLRIRSCHRRPAKGRRTQSISSRELLRTW